MVGVAFPLYKILSAKRLAQLIKESNGNGERFCFILGSGASVESGIPSGNSLEMQWMDCLMGTSDDSGTPAMDAAETRRVAAALYEEKKIGHKFEVIEKAWTAAKKKGTIPSEYYFDIYKLRFHAKPRNGYSYLEKIMERCEPSLGYHTLAKLLTCDSEGRDSNLNNLVITTNFDSLVEDALFLYTDKRPLVVSHESLADYIEANIQRPIVAKVHRGLLYAPFNSTETTSELKDEWRKALSYAFNTYTPIVIGYAGGDHSLMSFLEEDDTPMRNGIYWCYRARSGLPAGNIQKFVEKKDGYFITIDGFDALMMEIGKTMYEDAIRPSVTEVCLKKKHDLRVQRYNEQWAELSKKPETEEVLRSMNHAEQREEDARDEKDALTFEDYFRRGLRAQNENRPEDAIKAYTAALKIAPMSESVYNNRGNAYGDLGQTEKAIEDFNKAIQIAPHIARHYNNRGVVYQNLGEYQKAIEDYTIAIRLDPSFSYPYNNRGEAYYSIGQYQKAIEDCSKAIELDHEYAEAYRNRGEAYAKLGQQDAAEEDFCKADDLEAAQSE